MFIFSQSKRTNNVSAERTAHTSFFSLTCCVPGVLGGKFLERGRVKKPGQELFKSQLSEYFTAQDLYVGATLCINNKPFQLVDADEYTLNYMEQHAEEVRTRGGACLCSAYKTISC